MKTTYIGLLLLLLIVDIYCKKDNMLRKSIVFDTKTPDLFYCPIHKPTGFDKLIVRARPLKKLCEFEGKPIPEDYKSDCYKDVDESEYACKEKYRIMMRLSPPGSEKPYDGSRLKRFSKVDMEHVADKLKEKNIYLEDRLG